MDWRNWIVIERQIDDKYWNDIIKSRLETGDFYNIKILKKEENQMQDYLDFKALLEKEMSDIQNIDIDEIVNKRVEDFKTQVVTEELANKDAAIAKKQAEIDAIDRIIARFQPESATEEKQEEEE